MFESWSGTGNVTGHSLNIYDGTRGVWHQTWVDSSGSLLMLEGHFAGGAMVLESLPNGAALELARNAARALGLRVAAVDLFTEIRGEQDAIGIIEVNANPSIRLLEQSDRGDLILKIWHHTFSAMGLVSV